MSERRYAYEGNDTWGRVIEVKTAHRTHRCSTVYDAAQLAAALNAAEQATKERELLGKMAAWINEESGYSERGYVRSDAALLLAEYAALKTEGE